MFLFSYIKEFQYLAQSYNLTWHDICTILSSTLLLEERRKVWDVAKTHADDIHRTTPAHPVVTLVVPEAEPHWDYQTNGTTSRDQMVTCLVAGLKAAAQKFVNFDKLREIQQEEKENPASFQRFSQLLLQGINLSGATEGTPTLTPMNTPNPKDPT
jgi:hypothetical protein